MRQLLSFIKKEFLHIFRDRRTLFILLGMPIVQIIIFGFALTNEVKNARIAVLDMAKDEASASLLVEMDASQYFDISKTLQSNDQIEAVFRSSPVKMVVVIPAGFGEDLKHLNKSTIQLVMDASDPNVANTLSNYASAVIMDFQSRITQGRKLPYTIKTEQRMLYNPQMKGAYNFVPGVMAMVLLLVCTMMTAITIVREKETGTMEIMLVSPVRPIMVIMAKAIPYLLLSIVNITSILLLSVFVLEVPIKGSVFLLMMISILFTLVSLALGLMISSATSSQSTAMFISLIGMLLPTVMLSGFMFPVENMPLPLRTVSNVVPAKWYYYMVKEVMIKGLGVGAIWKEILILNGMLLFFLGMAIKNFKIRLA